MSATAYLRRNQEEEVAPQRTRETSDNVLARFLPRSGESRDTCLSVVAASVLSGPAMAKRLRGTVNDGGSKSRGCSVSAESSREWLLRRDFFLCVSCVGRHTGRCIGKSRVS